MERYIQEKLIGVGILPTKSFFGVTFSYFLAVQHAYRGKVRVIVANRVYGKQLYPKQYSRLVSNLNISSAYLGTV